jgi:hypothetical protein
VTEGSSRPKYSRTEAAKSSHTEWLIFSTAVALEQFNFFFSIREIVLIGCPYTKGVPIMNDIVFQYKDRNKDQKA